MAPPPEDTGPYGASTEVNTDPSWLQNPRTGAPIMGDGVKANLDDLTGYSKNMDVIQQNFRELGLSLIGPFNELISGAFPAEEGNGLFWSSNYAHVAAHNAGQFEVFVANMAMGVRNVASAAQAVATAYSNSDETSAASMAAINFAFGDKSAAPASIPRYVLDEIPTWNEFTRENPAAAVTIPQNGVPQNAVKVTSPDGNTTTITVTLPDGGELVTTTTGWGYYGGTGTTQTVTLNGKVQSVTISSTYAGLTVTEQRTTVYDDDGNRLREQVTSRDVEVVTNVNGAERTERSTTTYSYDDDGEPTGESTTGQTIQVGREREHTPSMDLDDDPAHRAMEELRPEPDPDEQTLAPGPLGEQPNQTQPGVGYA